MNSTMPSGSVAETDEHVFLLCFGDRDNVSSQVGESGPDGLGRS